MQCVICKNGNTAPGAVNAVLQRNGCTIIFKDVPADVCTNCGEYYLNEEVTNEILLRSENAIRNGAEVEILRYAA
jgi:YgiT-type zinc finger domain-containing protein